MPSTTYLARAAAAAALTAAAVSASAATMTLDSWTWGNGNAVSVSSPSYSGQAGGFTGTLSGSGVAGLDGTIRTYCVDLAEFFSFGVAYSDYSVVGASSYFGTRYDQMARLVSYVIDNGLFAATAASKRDDLSTALQLAIWNVVYDGDTSLAAGSFTSGTTAYTAGASGYSGANALLTASASWGITQNFWVLKSNGHQDQLLMKSAAVPEPASLALAGLGLAAAAAVRRRRAR